MSMTVDARRDVAPILKVLGVPMRWEIVRRLAVEDLCTCHLVDDLDAAQPLISHHLRVLREAGLVRAEPSGSFTYYVLDRAALDEVAEAVAELAALPRGGPRRRPCS
jgi:ArsR family transcriptional regulator